MAFSGRRPDHREAAGFQELGGGCGADGHGDLLGSWATAVALRVEHAPHPGPGGRVERPLPRRRALVHHEPMTETDEPIQICLARWMDVFHGDVAALDVVLADDVVLHSPVLFRPQAGKALVTMYLTAAAGSFAGVGPLAQPGGGDPGATTVRHPDGEDWDGRFRYRRQVVEGDHAVLEFETTMDGRYVQRRRHDHLRRRWPDRRLQGDGPAPPGGGGGAGEDDGRVGAVRPAAGLTRGGYGSRR